MMGETLESENGMSMRKGTTLAMAFLLCCGWGLHRADVGRIQRERYIADENEVADESGYLDSLHSSPRGVWSTELIAVSYPPCDPVSADAMESSLLNDKDERGIKEGLKRMGFTKISCGEKTVELW
jgi:hypothetical protein